MLNQNNNAIILAIPKGRIMQDILPLLQKWQIEIEADFFSDDSRKLIFDSNLEYIKIIKCRSFDVASFVSYGVADIAICGLDVLKEFSYNNIYNFLDLNIGKCRLSVAAALNKTDYKKAANIRVATKYPNLTKKYFNDIGIQTDIIKLNGAIEIAANLGLCDVIVDLVSTGATLKANDLVETDKIIDISSRMIINQASMTIKNKLINQILSVIKSNM